MLLFAVFLIFFIERLFHVVEQLCKVIHIHVSASKKYFVDLLQSVLRDAKFASSHHLPRSS